MVSSRGTTSRRRRASGSDDDDHRRKERKGSRSPSPKRERRGKEKEKSPSPAGDNEIVESMSIEETNKLRAKLGLAPLEVDDKPKERIDDDGLKVIVEDGTFEFKHKPSANWGEKKREQEIREKIEAAKKKREMQEKLFKGKARGLADSDSEDDTSDWVNKMRKQEAESKMAAEREKTLNEMDEDFGVTKVIEKSKKPKTKKQPKATGTAGMVIGHSKESFVEMTDQILVLEDKSVLDEGEETLINPNMIDNERAKKNVELKLRKDPNRNFDEDVDQYGNKKDFGLLSKYDDELEGEAGKRQKFRLDDEGGFDVDKEEREARIRHELEMANKKLVSCDMPNKYTLATEFYTQEEMVAFRKPKKVKKDKLRKRGKMLKADDLIPVEPAGSNSGSRDRGSRRKVEEEDEEGASEEVKKEIKEEEEEMETDDGRWKKSSGGAVDIDRLKKLANRESDEDSDDEFGRVDLSGVVVDDNAQDELSSILEKTRRFKQQEVKKEADAAQRVHEIMQSHGGVKMEVDSDGEEVEEPAPEGVIRMDTITEYCRNIGENLTYGLAGNRTDEIDNSELKQEVEEENAALERAKALQAERKERKRQKKMQEAEAKGGWREAGSSGDLDSDDERELEAAKNAEYDSSSDEEDGKEKGEYENVLGNEADVSKGVGAMLKLAAQKGYLTDPNAVRRTGQNLDHLRIQAKTQVDGQKYDIEDKYMKKLDRLGTTGRGPVMPFVEKKDYNPDVVIDYVDNKGRKMEQKEAYRELSYKFHGRKPGKKQSEKRLAQREKKELLKQMNSSDTPLGTLSKQREKQEQLQTPYLVLSGSGRNDHTSIKKE